MSQCFDRREFSKISLESVDSKVKNIRIPVFLF